MRKLSLRGWIALGVVALAVLISLGFVAVGCDSLISRPRTHREVAPEEFGRRFTPEELREDLRAMHRVCEEVHPDLYARVSKADVERRLASLEASIDRPLTRVEFFTTAARLAATFRDAHTTAQPPGEEWSAFLVGGGKILPFSVDLLDGEIVVRGVFPSAAPLRPGDRVVSINDWTMERLVADHADTRPGAPNWVSATLTGDFDLQLWLRGVKAPFRVVYRGRDGARAGEATLAGRGYQDTGATSAPASAPASRPAWPADFALRWLDGGVACIDFRSMSDLTRFEAFLEDAFTQIRDRNARGLIVDLRRNGGGDSRLGERLLRYVTDKPFRLASRKEWKSSARYRAFLKSYLVWWLRWAPLQYFDAFGRKFWSVEEGDIVVNESELAQPRANALRFGGPTCFLIGPSTFSSAMMLANAVEDYRLATLIGAETGESPNGFGEVYSFDLPHTRLDVGVSSALFVRANGDAKNLRGVVPDIVVEKPASSSASSSAAAKGDSVLERARAWIESQAPPR